MGRILITAKVNPDLDGTSCALAYSFFLRSTGEDAEGLLFGRAQPETLFFEEKYAIRVPFGKDVENGWGEFILVDASSMAGMPKVVRPDRVIEVIDHREPLFENEFPNAEIDNELVGAAATLVWERIEKAKVELPKDYGLLLYGAIFHDTLNLLSSNTCERDKKAVSQLEKKYGFERQIIKSMFEFITRNTLLNLREVLQLDSKRFKNFGGKQISALQLVLSDVKPLLAREKELAGILIDHKTTERSDTIFLVITDVVSAKTVVFCPDELGKKLVSAALGSAFSGNWIASGEIILRKQLLPKIREVVGKIPL